MNPSLVACLQPLAYCSHRKSFLIGITLVDVHLNWLNWFHFLILVVGPLIIIISCMFFFFFVTNLSQIPRCYGDVFVIIFFPRTARLWYYLTVKCFPWTCDLNGLKFWTPFVFGFSLNSFPYMLFILFSFFFL